jgi:KDO2-lipid IV(A) lauroyltransferase
MALPELDAGARRRVVRGVWENLGRTAGEFPHIGGLEETEAGPGWEVVGAEHIEAFAARGGPGILFTGHIANWEVMPLVTVRKGVQLATLYRPAENPWIDDIILELRLASTGADQQLLPKGALGARQALMRLRQGGYVGLLQDQKMNDGIEARFFGHPAMTASALAALALRLQCPVLPTYAQRLAPARFRVTYEPCLELPNTGNRAADVAALTQAVNDRLEAWIRAKPESWLWLHRRWPKDVYADL